jgi:hypothetical protein
MDSMSNDGTHVASSGCKRGCAMRLVAIGVGISALSGCGEVAVPFSVTMDFAVDGMSDIPEAEMEQIEQEMSGEWATEVTDLEEARGELPETAEINRIDVESLTIGSPKIGPIGQWIERCSLYASVDSEFSSDDLVIGSFSYLGETQEEVVMGIDDDIDALFEGDSIALIVQATLREIPAQPITLPVAVDGIGYVDPF